MSNQLSRRAVLSGAAAVVAASALPAPVAAALPASTPAAAPALAGPALRRMFEGLGLVDFEPPHPYGSCCWFNAIEEAIWTPTEQLQAGLCPCALCSIERDGM